MTPYGLVDGDRVSGVMGGTPRAGKMDGYRYFYFVSNIINDSLCQFMLSSKFWVIELKFLVIVFMSSCTFNSLNINFLFYKFYGVISLSVCV